jgi:putative colanic acid biosynthesis acetyltransferase WcaF
MNLRDYDRRGYRPGAGIVKRTAWYVVNATLFTSWLLPLSAPKCLLLRLFGARVGHGVVIKPRVNIKYPWHLVLGDHVWLGEGVWLDSLGRISVGDNVCISQEAYVLTGNHDYRDPRFGLIVQAVAIEAEAWIGARAVVCPGACVGRGAVLAAGGVLRGTAEAGGVYQGNPAVRIRERYPTVRAVHA